MITLRTEVLDVPAIKSVLLQNRESNTYQRTLTLRNLTASALTLYLETSTDGGATWSDIEAAFVIGAAGGGADVLIKNIAVANMIRLQGQGGGDDRDLQVSLLSAYLDTAHIWPTPAL